jgi:hypothetical protein
VVKVYIEQQYDMTRRTLRSKATTGFGDCSYQVEYRDVSPEKAQELCIKFVNMYAGMAEVVL